MIISSFDTFVEDNITLAKNTAKKYRKAFPTKSDDIYSVALYALVKACRDIEAGKLTHDNFKAYIITKIRGEILRYIRKEQRHNAQPFFDTLKYTDDDDEENMSYADYDEGLVIDIPYAGYLYSETINDFYTLLSDTEKEVLRLLVLGHTMQEIGTIFNRSLRWVEWRRNAIKDKYLIGR